MSELRHLKDRDGRQLIREFTQLYPAAQSILRSARDFQELHLDSFSIFFIDGKPLIVRSSAGLLPSLKFEEFLNLLPKIVVDMGAVPHLANGAHVMRPGIRKIRGDFAKGSLVVISDEKFGKLLALGLADMDSNAVRAAEKGKVITNVHYVGDKLWNSFKSRTAS